MQFKILRQTKGNLAFLLRSWEDIPGGLLSKEEIAYARRQYLQQQSIVRLIRPDHHLFLLYIRPGKSAFSEAEDCRKLGALLLSELQTQGLESICLQNEAAAPDSAYFIAEGLALAAYRFLKYKSNAKQLRPRLQYIYFDQKSIVLRALKKLQALTDACYVVRNLVNEPLFHLTATQLSEEIVRLGKEGRFRVQVLEEPKLRQLGMGGLLAVAGGSIAPPTFTVMEHRPANPVNKSPVVLVGNGIGYDSGTHRFMSPSQTPSDRMKSDISGAALIAGALYFAGQSELPIHLIGLIPAAASRPESNALVPGEVIRMYDGTTVEIRHTNAVGQLILADALHYAKKYRPELVLDFASLTGSAATALGDYGIVFMGTADGAVKQLMAHCGLRQYERLVEFPLWDEFDEQLTSEIADLTNIGGSEAGASVAGKFLAHFTDYPWLHFDIAGASFRTTGKDYRPAGGTATGLRLLCDFLIHYGGANA